MVGVNRNRNQKSIDAVVKAAQRIRTLEDEVGKRMLPFLSDLATVDKIAERSGVRAQYLIECAAYACGMKRRNKTPYRVKSRLGRDSD